MPATPSAEQAEAEARAAAEVALLAAAGAAAPALRRLLAGAPRYDLIAAIAAVMRAFPDAPGPGRDGPLAGERLRLRPTTSMAFPTADLAAAEVEPARLPGAVPRVLLTTTMLGLYGQSSPLPAYVGEDLVGGDESGAVRGFLDLFHHRLLALLARALLRHRLLDNREHDARLAALLGADPVAAGGAAARARLAGAGLFSQQPRSATGLAALLGFWFGGVGVEVEQCALRWTPLPEEARARLGQAACRLGVDCLAGERVLGRTTAFRIAVGPVDAATFRRFLPDGDGFRELAAVVAEFNPGHLDWDLDLVVAAADLPPATLGGGVRLGWDARLAGEPPGGYCIRFAAPAC